MDNDDIKTIETINEIINEIMKNIDEYDNNIEEELIKCKTELIKLELIHNDTKNELVNLVMNNNK